MNNKKIFLGINVSHGASASLMIDGEIMLAFQEERFNKVKNFMGYPKISIDNCIEYVSSRNLIINEAAFSSENNIPFPFKYPMENDFSIKHWLDYYMNNFFSQKKKN